MQTGGFRGCNYNADMTLPQESSPQSIHKLGGAGSCRSRHRNLPTMTFDGPMSFPTSRLTLRCVPGFMSAMGVNRKSSRG